MTDKIGDLRVWWIPQIPGEPFYVPVKNLEEAKLIMDTLAKYDIFQFENNIKPDYCNAGDLEYYEVDYGWIDWVSADFESFTEWCDRQDNIND